MERRHQTNCAGNIRGPVKGEAQDAQTPWASVAAHAASPCAAFTAPHTEGIDSVRRYSDAYPTPILISLT